MNNILPISPKSCETYKLKSKKNMAIYDIYMNLYELI